MKTLVHFLSTVTLRQAVSLLLIVCMLHLNVATIQAMSGPDPQTPNVSVSPIAPVGTTTVTIDPGAGPSKSILNWKDLNISDKQILEFVRDGGFFAILNRDMQSNATRIDGTILGNQGHIIVINRNGVILGPSSSVEALRFTTGSMMITDKDFLTEDALKFIVGEGTVENMGRISAEQVALIGREVINRGVIQTPAGGFVMLASADEVFLAENENSNVLVRLSSTPGFQGQVTNEQQGLIKAPEGTIILAAGDLFVQALDDLSNLGATVEMDSAGRVGQFGALAADGIDGSAGNIAMTAGEVVVLGQDSVTSANAGSNGDGGDVIVYSPDTAIFREGARVEAKGGSESGNGGFFDLSGKEYVEVAGDIDLTATNGKNGQLLIDPRNIKIVDELGDPEEGSGTDPWLPDWKVGYSKLDIDVLEKYLNLADVTISTDGFSFFQDGWVHFDAGRDLYDGTDHLNGSGKSLTVNARDDIILTSGINFNGTGDVTLNADKHIQINSALATGGNMNLHADVDRNVVGDMKSIAGATLTAGGNIDIRGNGIDLGDAVSAGGNLTITGRDCWSPDPKWKNVHAGSTLAAGGDIEISVTGEKKLGWPFFTTKYFPGTITLDDNVTAGGSISLYNDTYAANVTGNGVTLQAGQDIMLKNDNAGPTAMDNCTMLHGSHYLALEAGGQIHAENTHIQVTGSTLKLEQNPDLDLADFTLGNQANTDLIANSTGGSVTIVNTAHGGKNQNAADKWLSVESTANNNITLQGNGNIRAKALTSTDQGDIEVTSSYGDVTGSGTITTNNGNIFLKAYDDIELHEDVTANGNITLIADEGGHQGLAGGDITVNGKLKTTVGSGGNIMAQAGDDIFLNATPDSAEADGDIILTADSNHGNSPYSGDLVVAGNLNAGGNIELSASARTIYLGGDYVQAIGDITLNDDTELDGIGDQRISAFTGTLTAKEDVDKTKLGSLYLTGGGGIVLGDDVSTKDGHLVFTNEVIANGGDQVFDADGAGKKLIAQSSITKPTCGDLTLDGGWNAGYEIELDGDVTVSNGNLYIGEDNSYHDETTIAAGKKLEATKGDVRVANNINGEGGLTVKAGDDIKIYGNVNAAGHLAMDSGMVSGRTSEMTVYGNVTAESMFLRAGNGSLDGYKFDTITIHGNTLASDGGIDMVSDDHITLKGDVTATQHIGLYANADEPAGGAIGNVTVKGNITAGDYVEIDAADNTIYLGGDVYADEDYIWLMANTKLNGFGDQSIEAGSFIQADGYVRKCTWGDLWMLAWGANEDNQSIDLRYASYGPYDPAASTYMGNLWIVGENDIQISGDLTTFGPGCCPWHFLSENGYQDECRRSTGGVLVYAANGRIYTEGFDGLNVNVTGNSDHWAELGVYNPYEAFVSDDSLDQYEEMYHRVAIAIISSEDLILGPNGSLNAFGKYYDETDGAEYLVDDRALINFLDVPANIGNYDRDPGSPFDLAIYVASLDGDVHVDMTTQILSCEPEYPDGPDGPIALATDNGNGSWQQIPKGAMVIDAWDTVTFGPNFEKSLAGDGITSNVGDRLEVVSRISEWLEDAYGRLPYADPAEGDGPFPVGYAYVLRGAGLENPIIDDGRAWVLENRPEVAPLYEPSSPRLAGCPVEMDAAAAELGVHTDQLQVAVGNSLSINPTLNPCSACTRLIAAANILQDADGSRMAAMAYVFNQIAPAEAPFTPEMGAAIATAFSENAAADSQYASAMEYVDAFVQYVTVVDRDLGVPVGDSVAFVMSKYGGAMLDSGNTNMVAYVMMQLQQ